MINCFHNIFNNIEYVKESSFILPRNMAQNNLIESNMTAMKDRFYLNKSQFKELIGNLNWKRFSERIQAQLASNQLLTLEQRQLMEVNAIVSLILSHQFDQARQLWRSIRADNRHAALKGIGVYFHLRDKKFEDALKILEGDQDMFTCFLRSQVLLQQKNTKDALTNLTENFEASLTASPGYCNLLIQTAIGFEVPMGSMSKLIGAIE